MNRNGYREEKSCCCCFHPKQVVVGVCPLCLNERLLLLLASKQHNRSSASKSSSSSSSSHKLQSSINHRKQPTSSIHKIFAFGSLFTRLDSRHCKSDDNHNHFDVSPSPEEDSFISIKFEENGMASWEKSSKEKNCNNNESNSNTKSVIEHGKSRDTFRWRKRIGHMFQLIRWKKKSTGGVCHVGSKVEVGVKVRNKSKSNWMMRSSLTKRNKSKTTTVE